LRHDPAPTIVLCGLALGSPDNVPEDVQRVVLGEPHGNLRKPAPARRCEGRAIDIGEACKHVGRDGAPKARGGPKHGATQSHKQAASQLALLWTHGGHRKGRRVGTSEVTRGGSVLGTRRDRSERVEQADEAQRDRVKRKGEVRLRPRWRV